MGVSVLKEPSPEVRRSQVTVKTVVTVVAGALLTVGAALALMHAVFAVVLTVIALLIAVALDHVVTPLAARGLRRPFAIGVVLAGFVLVLVGLGFVVVPMAVNQTHALIKAAPDLIKRLGGSSAFAALEARFHIGRLTDLPSNLPGIAVRLAGPLFTAVGGVVSALAAVVTIAFLVVFMLLFGRSLLGAALAEARAERRERYAKIVHGIYRSIGGYLGGLLLICTINATLTASFLAIDHVPFFVPLGILSGFSSMIPYAGPVVAGTVISLLSWATVGIWHGVASAIYFALYGQLEGNLLSPLVFRRTINVNPLVVLLAVVYLAELAGVIGAVVAVPVVAVGQILLSELLRFRREQLALASRA